MLYLAEVQKETAFVGKGKTKLKLLACQRSEQSWSAVPGDDVIPADTPDAANLNAGALVLVDLSNSKQVQRIQEAGRQLVSILQNFSRAQEKAKAQEEEIEQWKQSLTYQSQELNRREMEMEARMDELRQMEADFEQLDQQRQEVDSSREEIDRLREEVDRQRQDLEGAWAHLEGERRRFDEIKADLQGRSSLDEEQARRIQDTLNRLSGVVSPIEPIREQVYFGTETINRQQAMLNEYWQGLEQQRSTAQQLQETVEQQVQDLQQRWQRWHTAQDSLEQVRADLKVQQSSLGLKQDQVQQLQAQRHHQDELHHQIFQLAQGSGNVRLGGNVNVAELEQMPLDQLQARVEEMQRDFEKISTMVSEQLEELESRSQTIADLQAQIQQASDYDRLRLETDLADEQEGYKFLEETIRPQKDTLRQKEGELQVHLDLLQRRQGLSGDSNQAATIDLGPVLTQVDAKRQQYTEELHRLEAEIEQLRQSTQASQDAVNQQTAQQEQQRQELKQLEETLKAQQRSAAELWGRVSLYQELLQPTQDNLNDVRQRLEGVSGLLVQFQETSDYQLQAINEMRQIVQSLASVPEMAAS